MKSSWALFLGTLCLTSWAWATAPEIDPDLCSPSFYTCTPHQQDLVHAFQTQGAAPAFTADEMLYQGSCFIVSPTYAPDHEHYGYIYLRKEGASYGFHGLFSFFEPQNPYTAWTTADAAKNNPESSPYVIEPRSNEWLTAIDLGHQWYYLVRAIATDKVVVIGQWGASDVIICEMKQNK